MDASGNRKGVWWELPLPGGAENPGDWLRTHYPAAGKLIARLQADQGLRVRAGRLALRLFPDEEAEVDGEWSELGILYEDDFCLVVSKPAGMAVHPSSPGQGGTLSHAVSAHYEATGQRCRIRHIHRLDKDTTGPVLFAKNDWAHLLLDEAMRQKNIARTYTAAADGLIFPAQGVIDAPIGRDRHVSGKRRVSRAGDPAVTRYETVEAFARHTWVRLFLETGRTHQIRVHLSSLGHPLVGDSLYGGSRDPIGRQALHGEHLAFPHPWSRETVSVPCPYPPDFLQLLDRLRQPSS